MKLKIWEKKKWLGYMLYSFLLAVGLLYYCFPSDAFISYLKTVVNRVNPRYLLSVGDVKPTFPPGFKFLKTGLSTGTKERINLFMADRLLVRPEIIGFLRGKPDYRFQCFAYGGSLNGHIHFLEGSITGPFNASIELKDVQIGDHESVSALFGRSISGTAGGTITYGGKHSSLIDGTGEANLRISDGRIKLLKSILSFDSINFDDLSMKVSLGNGRISLTKVDLEGEEIQCTLSGHIYLKKEFSKSDLDLRGTIRLISDVFKGSRGALNSSRYPRSRPKKGRLSFTIRGTIGAPTFRLI